MSGGQVVTREVWFDSVTFYTSDICPAIGYSNMADPGTGVDSTLRPLIDDLVKCK